METVIVDGRIVMENRRLTFIDEDKLRDEVEAVMPALRADIEAVAARNARMREPLLEAWRRGWQEDVGINRFVDDGGR